MSDEFEHDDTQSAPEPEPPATGMPAQPRWLPLGLGLIGLILILALAWPSLRSQVATRFASTEAPLAELEQATVANLADNASQYQLASASYQAGRFEAAWAQFRAVQAYRLAADTHPEIADAERAVQAAPAAKESHFKLGTVWAHAGLLEPAAVAYRQAIALDSQYTDAHSNLGVVYYQMGRLSDALTEYDAALAANPDDADVHHNKAAVYIQQALQVSPPDDALLNQGLQELQLALENNPELPQAHFSLGVVHMLQGQTQEAIAEFKRFQELDDGSDPQATQAAQNYLTQLEQ
jgi:tetratricopeptide (TPR) repeat protein